MTTRPPEDLDPDAFQFQDDEGRWHFINDAVGAVDELGREFTVVPRCILCEGFHTHGWEPELILGDREYSTRADHCGSDKPDDLRDLVTGESPEGYWLRALDSKKYRILECDVSHKRIVRAEGEWRIRP